jgi:hypothetical protein
MRYQQGYIFQSRSLVATMTLGQNNQPESDHNHSEKSENKAERVEKKAENKERGEASKHIADGELNKDIQANTLEKRLTRKSGATGYGVAPADSLLPTDTEIQKMGKQLSAKLEQEKPIATIAQNIGDNNPFQKPSQSPQVMTDATNAQQKPDAVIAQDFSGLQKWGGDRVQDVERMGWPHRGQEDKYLDYGACKEAFSKAHLEKYKEVSPELIAAAMRNEQSFYKTLDRDQDQQVHEKGTVLKDNGSEDDTASIGPAQIQIRKIRELVNLEDAGHKPKYPFLSHMKTDPVREALDPKNAALLTAAYFAQSAETLNRMKIPVNDQTLAYTWNPDVFKADGKYVCPNSIQMKAEHSLPKQMRPHRESVWNPTNDDILNTSTHVQNVKAQINLVRSKHLLPAH